jgi:hypothetical protein
MKAYKKEKEVKIYAILTSVTDRKEWLVLRAAADLSQGKNFSEQENESFSPQTNTRMISQIWS